jgi:hypothetical protein
MIVSVALLSACETWVEEAAAAAAGTGDTYRRLCYGLRIIFITTIKK